MTELILIRHGETDWNRELRFQGQVDVPLNATGMEQARRAARRLAGETVHQLYCSDLLRTRQTAEPVAAQFGLGSVPDPGLREQNFGVVDGLSVDEVQSRHLAAWERWKRFEADYAFEGAESTRQFHARVTAALRRMVAAHAGQTLVVVTHGGVLDMVWRTARGQGLDGPRECLIPNGGLNRVRVSGEAIDILLWGEVDHLADLPLQPVYDQSRYVQTAAATESSPSAA